jgi:hypothetical protein
MSGRQIRAFVALIACLVLLGTGSSAVLAKPSTVPPASSPGVCANGGYQNYTTSGGAAFSNEGQCAKYVARGGTLTPVSSSLSAIYTVVDGGYTITVAGTGLQPYATVLVTGDGAFGPFSEPATSVSGTGALNETFPFTAACGEYTSLTFSTLTAAGTPIQTSEQPPC